MDNQERQVISDIFDRLRQVEHQTRDPEAERFIADKVRQQPYAPYAMAQSVYVQEQALLNLNAEVEALREEVEQLRRQPQGGGGGFLSSIFGGGQRQPEPPRGAPWGQQGSSLPGYAGQQGFGAQQGGAPGPWGGQPGGMQQRGGGGFLQGALATAAGVAGGMMLGSVLTNAFGSQGAAEGTNSLAGGGEAAGESGGVTDGMYQDASASDSDLSDDFGGGGDGGDWA